MKWHWAIGPWTLAIIGTIFCMSIDSSLPAIVIFIGYVVGYADRAFSTR